MPQDLVAFLGQVPLFAELPDDALARIAALATWRHVPAGDELIREGDPGRDLVIVFSGRLEISRVVDGSRRVLGTAGHLTPIGELSLLTHEPRTASVRALRDTLVVQIAGPDFETVLLEEPGVCLSLARTLAGRLTDGRPPPPRSSEPTAITVVPLADELPLDEIVAAVADELARHGRTEVVRTPSSTGDSPGSPRSDELHRAWLEQLDRIEQDVDHVLLVVDDPIATPDWAAFCTRSVDRVLLLARGGRAPAWALADPGCHHRDLVLVSTTPSPTRFRSLDEELAPRARHIVDPTRLIEDAGRAARRVSGHAVGVVFSGGGARGMAHVGVIAVLEEAGIRIDRVGGCSAGALAAALVASGRSAEEILAITREEFVEHNPFGDVTFPREALTKGRRMRSALERIFGDVDAAAVPLPLYAVSADLDVGELVVHTSGPIRSIVGASMAIPGLAPPVRLDGRLLVDGGLLDNFPVDVMAEHVEGPIIGVDVMRQLPPTDGGGIVGTVARAMVLGAQQRMGRNRQLADLVITPEVADIGLLAFDRFDDAVAAGHAAALEALGAAGEPWSGGLDGAARAASPPQPGGT